MTDRIADQFALIKTMVNAQVKQEADAAGQMTLGAFIAALSKLPPDKRICFGFASLYPRSFLSYRGYYDHLALDFDGERSITVEGLLAKAKDALGATFDGYKGGDFLMNEDTPLWAGEYGRSGGSRIVGLQERKYEVLILTVPNDE